MPTFSFKSKVLLSIIVILFFTLPFLEGDLRTYGYIFLLFTAGFMGIFTHWRKVKFDLIEVLFLLFLIIGSISTIFSQGIARSFLELLRYTSYFLIFIGIRRLSEPERKFIKKIYITAILTAGFLLSIVSLSFLLHIPFIPYPSSGMNLYYANFGHNKLADLLLFAIPILYFVIISSSVLKILFLFLSVVFMLTFSKSGYLAIMFIFVLMTGFLGKKVPNINISLSKIIIIPTILMSIAFIFIVVNTYFFHFKERPFYSKINKPLYLDWRWDYYRATFEGLKKSPFIGVGLDNFRYLSKLYQSSPFSWSDFGENYYFTLFSETGILGGLTFLLLLCLILYNIRKSLSFKPDLTDIGIYLALIASGTHVIFSVDWYFLSIFLYFWIGLALVMPSKTIYKNDSRGNMIFLTIISLIMLIFALSDLLGLAFYRLGTFKKSDNLFRVSSIFSFWNTQNLKNIASFYNRENDLQNSTFYYGIILRLEAKEYFNYVILGDIMDKYQKKDEATIYWLTAVSLNPLDLNDYYLKAYKTQLLKAYDLFQADNLEGALNIIDKTTRAFPAYAKKAEGANISQKIRQDIEKGDSLKASKKIRDYINKGLSISGKITVSRKEVEGAIGVYVYKNK